MNTFNDLLATVFSNLLWISWILGGIASAEIGKFKGYPNWGLVMGICFGIIGCLAMGAFPNRLTAQSISEQNTYLKFLAEKQGFVSTPLYEVVSVEKIKVSRDGKDLGVMTNRTVNQMIQTGQLRLTDYYLDTTANEWKPLQGIVREVKTAA